MKTARPPRRRVLLAFTLVEMIVVMAIISLLVSLSLPAFSRMMLRARSTQCAANLSSIGMAVSQAASDNDNTYPEISQAAQNPYPAGSDAKDLYDTLSPYGITSNTLQCPIDVAGNSPTSAYKLYGSSYEWNPAFDDEVTVTPIIYWSANVQIPVNNTRVRLCYDFNPVHNGKMNALYGDGHVRAR